MYVVQSIDIFNAQFLKWTNLFLNFDTYIDVTRDVDCKPCRSRCDELSHLGLHGSHKNISFGRLTLDR